MLMCADPLQKTKCLTNCLKNLSQLRWLALQPLVQMSHQTTSLAPKGETKRQSASLCCGASYLCFISIPPSFQCRTKSLTTFTLLCAVLFLLSTTDPLITQRHTRRMFSIWTFNFVVLCSLTASVCLHFFICSHIVCGFEL